jgi:hypothetical protein
MSEPPPPPPPARPGASSLVLGLGALVFVALWFSAWELFAGNGPIHGNNSKTVSHLGPQEAPFFIAAALVQGAIGAWATALLARRWPARLDERWRELLVRPDVTYAALGAIAAALALVVGLGVLGAHPITEDEKTYLYQAHLLLQGRLSEPVPPEAVAFWQPFVVNVGDRWSGQYFWGQPAALALGLLVSAPWIIAPIEAAVTVFFTGKLAAEYAGDDRAGVLAAALAALSPIVTLSAGTFHSANLSATCAAVSLWACARLAKGPVTIGRRRAAAALAISVGVALHNRPLDEAALLAGVGVLLLVRFRRDVRGLVRAFGPAVLASLPFVALWLAVNRLAWGGFFTTGYAIFNGGLGWITMGFGTGPFNIKNSPAFAAAKTLSALARLAFYVTGSPIGFALLALPALGVGRSPARGLAPLVPALFYVAAYFVYAGAPIDPTGPVYYLALAPLLLAWIAVVAVDLHDLCRGAALRRLVPAMVCAQALAALVIFWPAQIAYLRDDVTQAEDCEVTVEKAGIARGLVFVLTGPLWRGTSTWHRRPPFEPPPFDRPLLFAGGRGLAADLAAMHRFAEGRPVYLEHCFSAEKASVLRYDPERHTVSSLDGSDVRTLEPAPPERPAQADYEKVFKVLPDP